MIWVMLGNPDDLQRYRTRFMGEGGNMGFLIEDGNQGELVQVGDVVLSTKSNKELESYLLNFMKRSKTRIPPSMLPK